MTKIIGCRCANAYQDKKYGRQNRVHNLTQKTPGRVWRCTSCKNEVNKSIPDTKAV